MRLSELAAWLDDFLAVRDIRDWPGAVNGLQVENSGTVTRVAAAVDACQAVIDAAATAGADLLLVHHGLYWHSTVPMTGRTHRRFSTLINRNLAVYAAHLPLDVHPEVGNNAELARLVSLPVEEWWGEVEGRAIGVAGRLAIQRGQLAARLARALGTEPRLMAFGPERCARVGIITGSAGSMIRQAAAAGCDTFITGEGQHHTYFDAEELGLNVFFAGHYATETLGVQALAARLEREFGLPWSFLDHPTGL
jgi:dinuclear metal center YbgI/SA1388 family protein